MDISSIAGSALLMKTSQTQQSVSMSLMKQAADQQDQMANLLAQNVRQAVKPAAEAGSGFSTYA